MIFWLALTYCLGQTTTLSFSLFRIDKGVIASREEEVVDPSFALSAFSGRRDEQFTSKLQTVSTVPSVTRHKTEMNRNWMAPPLCRKSQKARGVCIVAARAGRCWNLSSHGGG